MSIEEAEGLMKTLDNFMRPLSMSSKVFWDESPGERYVVIGGDGGVLLVVVSVLVLVGVGVSVVVDVGVGVVVCCPLLLL